MPSSRASAVKPDKKKKAGRKPLSLTAEERKERRLQQNRRAQLNYRAKKDSEEANVIEHQRRLKAHAGELRALVGAMQGALTAVLDRVPVQDERTTDVQLVAARALANAPLPLLPELLSEGNAEAESPLGPAPAAFADLAPLLSLGSAAFSTPFNLPTPPETSDEPTSLLFANDSDLYGLLGTEFPASDVLMSALRDTLLAPHSGTVKMSDIADELLRDSGIFVDEPQTSASCSGICSKDDDACLRRCFDSLPHITMRSLLHALQSARFTGVNDLCSDLKAYARKEGEKWTVPCWVVGKWPVLRGIPLGERD